MKKFVRFALALLLVSCLAPHALAEKKISVVTTIFPIYDWVREIVGENDQVEVTLLQDTGTDLHSYQPTTQDIMKISTADLFIYVDGESDDWVDPVLDAAMNRDLRAISLLDSLGDWVKTEELVEGMEHSHDHDHGDHDHDEDHDHDHDDHDHDHDDHDHDHDDHDHDHDDHDHDHDDHDHDHDDHDHDHDDHDHDHDDHDHDHDDHDHDHDDHDHDHEHDAEEDEHVWLSLRNASQLVSVIEGALSRIDPAHEASYRANAAAYKDKLSALDKRYAEVVSGAKCKTLLFGDRFPFRYLVDDYNLEYYAAFSGCSAESEASFKTIVFLAGKVDELALPAVLTIENPKTRIAQTVVENTAAKDQKILSLNSMQGTTRRDIDAGSTYLSVMEENLLVLQDALN